MWAAWTIWAYLGLDQFGGAVRDLIPGAVADYRVSLLHPAQYNDTLLIHVRIARLGTRATSPFFDYRQENPKVEC